MESKRIYRNSKNHWNIKYLYIFHLDIPARQRRDIFWFWWLRLIFRLWPAKAPETHHPTIAQHKRCALQWIKSQINSKNMKCKMWWVSCCDMSYFQSFCIHMQNCPPIPRRPFMSEASNWLLFQRSSWLHTLHFKNGSLQLQHFTQKGLFFFKMLWSAEWCPGSDACNHIVPYLYASLKSPTVTVAKKSPLCFGVSYGRPAERTAGKYLKEINEIHWSTHFLLESLGSGIQKWIE